MIWMAIGFTVVLVLVGCLALVACVAYCTFSPMYFEDRLQIVLTGIIALLAWGFAALPWVLGVGAS